MDVPRKMLLVGRVLHQDDDFLTIEVGKHDGVTFHLQQDEDTGEVVGGDQFLTLMFVHQVEGSAEVWLPWAST